MWFEPFQGKPHGQESAWAGSLFEDTAEYGLGMALASVQRRDHLNKEVNGVLRDEVVLPVLMTQLRR